MQQQGKSSNDLADFLFLAKALRFALSNFMPVEPQKPYISSKEAAKKFGLTNDHIGLLCRRGKVVGLLWGRVWYVSETSLEEYLKKNIAEREARKQQLSRQWRAAWTAAFVGFVIYSGSTYNASADYVTPIKPEAKVEVAPVNLSLIADRLSQVANVLSVPAVPNIELKSVSHINPLPRGLSFSAKVYEGLVAVGEVVVTSYEEAKPSAHVTYAHDYVPEQPAHTAEVAEPSLVLASVVEGARELAAEVPTPEVAFHTQPKLTFFTQQTIAEGVEVANQTLSDINDGMFAMYADSVKRFVAYAQFDATQAGFVYDQTFGELGRQYVEDLNHLGDAQVAFYIGAADKLDHAYNAVADATDNRPAFDASISVASVAEAYPSESLAAAVGDTVGGIWSGAVDWLSNIYVAVGSSANKFASNTSANPSAGTPAQIPPQKSSGLLSDSKPSAGQTFALGSAPSLPVTLPAATNPQQQSPEKILAVSSPRTEEFLQGTAAKGAVTQDQLNNQFAAWLLVVKNLIAGNTGYVDNPSVAALGNGGGGVVNNYYALSQRIDKLDGVTITNSSINGVSDFSNLGSGGGGSSQWGDSGSDIYFNSGKVGIGTTTPAYPLSVAGPAYSSSGFITDGSDTGGVGYYSFMNPDEGAVFGGLAPGGYPGGFIYFPGIDHPTVGFGDTPGGAVVGLNAANGTNAFVVSNFTDPTNYTPLIAVPSTGGLAVGSSYSGLGLPPTDGLIVEGKAGIGNPNPASKLDVFGSAQLDTDIGTEDVVHIGRKQTDFLKNVSVLGIAVGSYEASGNSKTRVDFKLADDSNLGNDWGNNPDITILTLLASGKVGIGTTSPYAKLSVAGDIVGTNITATGTLKLLGLTNQSCLGTDASGNVQAGTCSGGSSLYASTTIGAGTQAAGLTVSGGATTTGTSFLSGNVGIGGQPGSNALTVTGSANLSSTLQIGSAAALARSSGNLLLNNTGAVSNSSIIFYTTSSSASTERARIDSATGNVGIGTTSPAAKLGVAGGAYIGGNLTATGSLTILGGTSIGNFNVDATVTCSNTYHTFIGTIGTVGGDECAALNVTQLDANSNVIYRFGGAGQTWAGEFYANSSLVGMNTKGNIPLSFQIGQSEAMRITTNGKIGMGTTNPLGKLHVYGAQTNPGPVNFSTTSIVAIGGDSPTGYVLAIGQNTSNNSWIQSGYTGPISVLTNLLLQPVGGKVGIGTTTPGSQLSVSSGVSIGADYGTAAPTNGLIVEGNVGIGTNNPFRSLSVAAPSGQVTSASFTTNDFTSTVSGSSLEVYFGASSGDTYSAIAAKSGGLLAWNNLILQQGGGKVGIGTTTPGATLAVQGTALAQAWNTYSDRTLKEHIVSLDAGLPEILQLAPVKYNFIGASTTQYGFIAQDVAQIPGLSSVVSQDSNGLFMMNYEGLIAPVVRSLQDIAHVTANFKDNLIAWLGDASNGINKLFAKEVHTDELCVGSTCVSEEQFLAMVAASSASPSAPASAPALEPAPDASSTPEVAPEPSSEATSSPDTPDATSTPEEVSEAGTTTPAL